MLSFASVEPPSPPTDVHVTPINDDSVQLTWKPTESDNQSPVTGFIIERLGDSDNDFVTCGRVGADCGSYVVRGLPMGSIQKFRVRAFNQCGLSSIQEVPEINAEDDTLSKLKSTSC